MDELEKLGFKDVTEEVGVGKDTFQIFGGYDSDGLWDEIWFNLKNRTISYEGDITMPLFNAILTRVKELGWRYNG